MIFQLITDSFHERVVKIEVMHHTQPHGEHFLRLKKMAQISTRMSLARGTVAFRIDRAQITLIFCIIQVDDPIPGEQVPMACVTAWHYAVKQINASADAFQDVPRRSDAH